MIAKNFDLQPVATLLEMHAQHAAPYRQEFMGLDLTIHPEVFNPAYTKVTRLLAETLSIESGDGVLDMFCGSGVLGLLLSDTSSKVVGVDISPKAIECAQINALRKGTANKTEYRQGSLWAAVNEEEQFDLIVANPPLLPATPETLLEMAVADSPEMSLTTQFISGSRKHLKDNGRVLMAFSDASKNVFGNPLGHVEALATRAGLSLAVVAEKNVGYEIYRVLELRKDKKWQE